ncbi:UDP-N-acetylmuramate dehydrogenase [Bacteroidota bacterium]
MPEILQNHSLRELNSFHFEVSASNYCECRSEKDIQEIITTSEFRKGPVLILGEGSNILFSGDYKGLIIRPLILGREIIKEDPNNVWIKAGAGENWDEFVAWTTAWGYGGIENLSLIPGSVGSSPIQNIGAYGVEVEKSVEEVSAIDVLTGQKLTFKNESCRFGYRDSIFKRDWKGKCIITSVTFRLSKNPKLNLSYQLVEEKMASREKSDPESLRQVIIEIRRSKLPDPDELGNAGSFFKNPLIPAEQYEALLSENPEMPSYPAAGGTKKIPAAWLIDQCGWKGKRIGDAGSYEKQALVLVNYGSASGQEILDLSAQIEQDIRQRFGISLEKEVNVI